MAACSLRCSSLVYRHTCRGGDTSPLLTWSTRAASWVLVSQVQVRSASLSRLTAWGRKVEGRKEAHQCQEVPRDGGEVDTGEVYLAQPAGSQAAGEEGPHLLLTHPRLPQDHPGVT